MNPYRLKKIMGQMMDIKRLLLTVGLAVVGVMLWTQWQHEHPSMTQSSQTTVVSPANSTGDAVSGFVPPAANSSQSVASSVASPHHVSDQHAAKNQVQVKTDTLHFKIDLQGGNIVSASLPQYPVSLQKKNTPIRILTTTPGQYYVLQSGVTSNELSSKPVQYSASQRRYQLAAGEDSLKVTLTAQQAGLQITKTYLFKRGEYQVHLVTTVKNISNQPWTGSFYHQIARQKPAHHFGSMAYNAGAISSQSTPYEKIKYATMDKSNLNMSVKKVCLCDL